MGDMIARGRWPDYISYSALGLLCLVSVLATPLRSQAQDSGTSPPSQENTGVSSDKSLRDYDREIQQIAERVMPAVVQIVVSGFGPAKDDSDDTSVIARQNAQGSGVIVDPNGYIITNAHVVAGAQRIKVLLIPTNASLIPYKTSFANKQRTFTAKLVGINRLIDLALLKIDATGLPSIPLQEDFRAQLGQAVLAIGSPLGLDHTITRGIVSAVGRQPDIDKPMVYIQTDAPINPGNSGGALVDSSGNLLGINTFIYTKGGGSEGLGFAIPQPAVRFVYQELKQYGRVRETYIGADVQTITTDLAAGLNLPQDWGVIVANVVPDGPADKIGLQPEDIIVTVDGRPVDSMPKYWSSLYIHPHDKPIKLEVMRGTQKLQFAVDAVDAQTGLSSLADLIDENSLVLPLGIFVVDLSKDVADQVAGLRSKTGVIVAGRTDSDPPIDTDLAMGDVIRSINRTKVSNVAEFRDALKQRKAGDPVVLQIERGGAYRYVAFEIE
jgi:serine protease Do